MKLKEILSISGHGGLFKYISQGKNGIIVEHIQTGKRMHAFASAKVSSMADISVFTETEDVPLKEVFENIKKKESGAQAVDSKSDNETLKNYFAEILPTYDRERVYVSDIKKIISWYNILHDYKLLDFEDESETDAIEETAELQQEETKQEDNQSDTDK